MDSPVDDPSLQDHFPSPDPIPTPTPPPDHPDDSDTDSDDPRAGHSTPRLPALPILYRNILKCSIAYFIGSLFTYSDRLSALIAGINADRHTGVKPSASGHMVATV